MTTPLENLDLACRTLVQEDWLWKTEGWNTLDVDYQQPPRVERLWRPFAGGRFCLHRIHRPPEGQEPYFHPHKWSSAMVVLLGSYHMNIGHGAGVEPPPVSGQFYMAPGSAYVMEDPNLWHSVHVKGARRALTAMWMGPLFQPEREMPDVPEKELQPLSEEDLESCLKEFRMPLLWKQWWGTGP